MWGSCKDPKPSSTVQVAEFLVHVSASQGVCSVEFVVDFLTAPDILEQNQREFV
jgi:hypothetical protein